MQIVGDLMRNNIEIGRIGQKRYGGIFYEEFLYELRGKRGIETYREMSENDDTIGAILYAIEMLMRQATWTVTPGGDSQKDKEAAEFVESCMYDMQDTWTDTISEILSFLTYGWSYHEIVYKRRMGATKNPKTKSKYSDGLIGWRKLPIRAQETLYQWEFDNEDNLLGMTQMPPPNYGLITVPIEKAMLFRTKSRKGNPEGRSILRNAYRSWYFKKRIQEFEGIGIERDLAGLPVFTAPEGINIWDNDDPDLVRIREGMEAMVRNVRVDELAGIVKPFGYEFELLSSGGSKMISTNEVINRYNTGMAMTVLADFIFLGHQQVGSFALSSDKTELFSMAICAYLDIICETFNSQGIPRLIDINGEHFAGITDYPHLEHGDIENADIQKLAAFIRDLSSVGAIIPDGALEDYLRKVAGLPERTEDDRVIPVVVEDQQNGMTQERDKSGKSKGENPKSQPKKKTGEKKVKPGDADESPPEEKNGAYGKRNRGSG